MKLKNCSASVKTKLRRPALAGFAKPKRLLVAGPLRTGGLTRFPGRSDWSCAGADVTGAWIGKKPGKPCPDVGRAGMPGVLAIPMKPTAVGVVASA
eukprot:scaffold87251_cov31-Tisochrysis_lutea.AAC.4